MSNFNVGNIIKINPERFPENVKNDDLVAELGYPGLFRFFNFEIEKIENDVNRGEIVWCKITNPDVLKEEIENVKRVVYEGSLVLLTKDIIPANMKVTLDYVILNEPSSQELVRALFVERKKMTEAGQKKSSKAMRENWKQIQILRGEVEGEVTVAKPVKVRLPKHNGYIDVEVQAKDLPDGSEESVKKFKQMLTNKIRGVRRERKQNSPEVVEIAGTKQEKLGGVFLREKSILTAYEEFMKTTLEIDKKPIDPKSTYVGIEIEMIYSGAYDTLKKMLIEAKLHKNVTLKSDGSLRACHNNPDYQTMEMTVLVRKQDMEGVLQRLDKILAHPSIDAYANRTCGLHVHLDMRKRDPSLVYKNMVRIQNLLRGSQPVGRIKNTHCRANEIEDYDFQNGDSRQPRYSVVNGQAYARHKSIEIRIHEGTTDCESIYNWALFLDSIAEYKKEIPKNNAKLAEEIVSNYNVDIPLSAINYVDSRIKRFNSLAV